MLVKLRKIVLLLTVLAELIPSVVFAQQLPESAKIKHYFCIKLVNGTEGQEVRYGILTIGLSGNKTVQFLTLDEWMKQFTGRKESKANPDRVDYMREYKISFKTIKNLWKLKFSEYPWGKKHEEHIPGWAAKPFSPSPAQMQILREYGIKKFITDPIYGDNLFRLLQDMQNPEWVQNYINAQ